MKATIFTEGMDWCSAGQDLVNAPYKSDTEQYKLFKEGFDFQERKLNGTDKAEGPTQPKTQDFNSMDNEARLQYLKKMVDSLANAVTGLNTVSEAFQRHDHVNGRMVFYPPSKP